MSEPIDLDAGWNVLTRPANRDLAFADSPVCRAVFDRIPGILGDLRDEIAAPASIADARLRIALDVDAIDALRDAGFRFAEPPHEEIPSLLLVNGDSETHRMAARYHIDRDLPVIGLLAAWPQCLVWFAKR